ncbi:hypothetical protein [Gordonia alkaliphila]|uniref:Uncharacterized protein n=1 Tax=Gordonia alkaliphila TaxID=1053547 RepID=A0ABP8ZH96_9ACTN
MTEQQEPNQQTLAELARTLLHLSRALDEAHNLAASAVEDRDFALAERDELREQVAELRAERDELAATVARVEALAVWTDPDRMGGIPCVRGTHLHQRGADQ